MARQVLFVQGGGEGVHDGWDDRLVASLRRELGDGYDVRYPVMPNEADPSFATWKAALTHEFAALDEGAHLVGHSIGATVLVATLAEIGGSFASISLLAAPFIGEGGWPSGEIADMSAVGNRLPSGLPVFLYQGDHDDTVPPGHLDLYARAIPWAATRRLAGRGHQLNDDLREVAEAVRRVDD